MRGLVGTHTAPNSLLRAAHSSTHSRLPLRHPRLAPRPPHSRPTPPPLLPEPAVAWSALDTMERFGSTPAMVASATTRAREHSAAAPASSLRAGSRGGVEVAAGGGAQRTAQRSAARVRLGLARRHSCIICSIRSSCAGWLTRWLARVLAARLAEWHTCRPRSAGGTATARPGAPPAAHPRAPPHRCVQQPAPGAGAPVPSAGQGRTGQAGQVGKGRRARVAKGMSMGNHALVRVREGGMGMQHGSGAAASRACMQQYTGVHRSTQEYTAVPPTS